jgi:hypothetical protein
VKKILLLYILTANILLLHCCTPEQDCPATTPIKFRGVPISFPQTGWKIRKQQPSIIFNGDLYLNSTSGNTDIAWFLERGDFPFPLQDTAAHLRERDVYGMALPSFLVTNVI